MNLIYQVAVGEVPEFYAPCIASVARYCERYDIEHIVQREPLLKIAPLASKRSVNALRLGYLPIFEKAVAFSYLDRYDRIAIVDADVFVRKSAPDIFEQVHRGDAFAGVLEREMPLTPIYFDKIRKYSDGQYRLLTDVNWDWMENGAAFYNMGVMLLGDSFNQYLKDQTPTEFIRRKEFERFVNGEGHWRWSTDQTLLNWWVKKTQMPVRRLDWRWNALYGAVRDASSAYFIHFFLAAKMPRAGAEIPALVEELV